MDSGGHCCSNFLGGHGESSGIDGVWGCQGGGFPKSSPHRSPRRPSLYYTILYYTILCYAMLFYAILSILSILYYTILYYTILYYAILYYTILNYTAWRPSSSPVMQCWWKSIFGSALCRLAPFGI